MWLILFVLVGTFGYFTDDYEPYEEIVLQAYVNPFAQFHIEPLWIWLAGIVKGDVTQFRLIGFGLLGVGVCIIPKILGIKLNYFISYYSMICLSPHLCWIRQPIAMFLFSIGLIALLKKRLIVSGIIFLATFFIHKIGIIMLLLIPFIFFKINRRNMIFLLAVIPLIYSVIILISQFSDSLTINIFNEYSEADGKFANRNIIYTIINTISLAINLGLLIFTIYHYKEVTIGIYAKLLRYLFGVTYITILLLVMPIQVDVMLTRMLSIANLFMVIFMSKFLNKKLIKKNNKFLLLSILILIGLRELGMLANNNTRLYRLTKPLF